MDLIPVQGLQLWLRTLAASSSQVSSREQHSNITPVYRQPRGFDSTSPVCFLTCVACRHFLAERRPAPGQHPIRLWLPLIFFFFFSCLFKHLCWNEDTDRQISFSVMVCCSSTNLPLPIITIRTLFLLSSISCVVSQIGFWSTLKQVQGLPSPVSFTKPHYILPWKWSRRISFRPPSSAHWRLDTSVHPSWTTAMTTITSWSRFWSSVSQILLDLKKKKVKLLLNKQKTLQTSVKGRHVIEGWNNKSVFTFSTFKTLIV